MELLYTNTNNHGSFPHQATGIKTMESQSPICKTDIVFLSIILHEKHSGHMNAPINNRWPTALAQRNYELLLYSHAFVPHPPS